MNRKKNIIFIIILIVLLLFLALFFSLKKKNTIVEPDNSNYQEVLKEYDDAPVLLFEPQDLMTEEEEAILGLNHLGIFDVISRDSDGKPLEYRKAGMEKPKFIEEIDWMTDEEKGILGIPLDKKIQVLQRNEEGKIISWTLIEDSSDIYKFY